MTCAQLQTPQVRCLDIFFRPISLVFTFLMLFPSSFLLPSLLPSELFFPVS